MTEIPKESSIEAQMAASNLQALGDGARARRAGQPRSANP
jgi:hypothetical protein